MRKYHFIPFFFVALFSCKKDNTQLLANPGSEYFPNSVGNYWKYKYVDSIANTSVFVEVNIIGNTVLPGGQNAKIWTYTFPGHIDTSFVYQDGNTIKFVDRGLSVRNSYTLPLVLNNQWKVNPAYVYDSIQVIDNRAYQLNDQNFDNSFLLYEYGHLPNDHWNKFEWFCPNIGMITKNEKDQFLIAATVSVVHWELVEYNLK